MDDEKQPPPRPDEVKELQKQSLPAMPEPGDTLPGTPVPERSTGQGLPPPPGPQAGKVMPPTPQTAQTPLTPGNDEAGPGLNREIENVNIDAVAQADQSIAPDRHSAEALRDIVQGGRMPVEVNNIDRELIQVWKSTTSGGDNEGKVAVTLMRAMNLIVYVDDEAQATAANEVISRVVGRHPCRTIMIVNQSGATHAAAPAVRPPAAPGSDNGSADEDLEAVLSAHCQIADSSGKKICCEQISVIARSPAALGRVSNVALNLLITDLPVFLWWAGGAPFNNAVLTNLEDSFDRLIVDSAQFSDPMAALLALSRIVDPAFRRPDSARYAPGDFNWDRIQGWREATAQLFDTADFTASLWRIGSVEIEYAAAAEGARPNPVQAFLFAGWFATRLGLEFHSSTPPGSRTPPGDFVLTLRQNVRSIPVLLRAIGNSAAGPGGLLTVRLTTNEASPTTFVITDAGDHMFLDCVVERDGKELLRRKIRYTQADDAELLDAEMELFGHDAIYEETLAMAGLMAWGSLSLGRRAEVSAQLGNESRQSSFDPRF